MSTHASASTAGNGSTRSTWLELAALLAAVALPLGAALIGARGPTRATLNFGPNDAYYLSGFLPEPQIEGDVATRWTMYSALVDLPLTVEGSARLWYRFARILPQTAVVVVAFDGQAVDRFTCRGGVHEVRRTRLGVVPRTPLRVGFQVDSHDRRNLGLRMDWLRVVVDSGGVLRLRGWAFARPALLMALLFVALRLAGFARLWALGLVSPWALALAAATLIDPLSVAHLTMHLTIPMAALAFGLAVWLRWQRFGRWVVFLVLISYAFKGAALFHPRFFYFDSHNHARYVQAMAAADGNVLERGLAAQKAVNTAYPRFIAGKAYAFPYSPLFFVPFTQITDFQLIEDSMRHWGLIIAALEVLLAFWLARLAFGDRVGLIAAVLAAFLPPFSSRVLLAMWPTMTAHVFEVLAIGAALLYLREPASRKRLGVLALFAFAAFLTYISSLFNLCLFLGCLGLIERRRALALWGVMVATASLTVVLLYLPFTRLFVSEILPALLSNPAAAGQGGAAAAGPLAAFGRIPLFFGWAIPLLALAGLWLMRRRAAPETRAVLAGYALTVLLLFLLRAFGGSLFKDLKETTFMVTLIAVLCAVTLDALMSRGRQGAVAAVLVIVGLTIFGLDRYRGYVETYAFRLASVAKDAPE